MLINLQEINNGAINVHTDDIVVCMPLNGGQDYDAGARTLLVVRNVIAGKSVFRRVHVKETEYEVNILRDYALTSKG